MVVQGAILLFSLLEIVFGDVSILRKFYFRNISLKSRIGIVVLDCIDYNTDYNYIILMYDVFMYGQIPSFSSEPKNNQVMMLVK